MVEGLPYKQRRKLDRALAPVVVINDPNLPEALQGMVVPEWFDMENPTG